MNPRLDSVPTNSYFGTILSDNFFFQEGKYGIINDGGKRRYLLVYLKSVYHDAIQVHVQWLRKVFKRSWNPFTSFFVSRSLRISFKR